MDLKLTPTQQRLYDVLSDGKAHTFAEMFACIDDELSSRDNLHTHVTYLRRKLRTISQEIVVRELPGGPYWILTRLIDPLD